MAMVLRDGRTEKFILAVLLMVLRREGVSSFGRTGLGMLESLLKGKSKVEYVYVR